MMQADYQKMKKGFEDYLKTRMYSPKSIRTMMAVLNLYYKWLEKESLEAQHVTYNDLLYFMKSCASNGATQKTIENYMWTVRHLYEYFTREGTVEKNPAEDIKVMGVKKKTLYRILVPHELHTIYNSYVENTPTGIRNKAMLGLLVYQGLTTAELEKLNIKDINIREGRITVPGGRKSNGRQIRLEAHQVMDLYEYILKAREEILSLVPKGKSKTAQGTDQLFIGRCGSSSNFSNLMAGLMKKVRKINPVIKNARHIRASVITKWLKQHNLREVQYLAGHRYISSTESYQQNDMEGLLEEIQQYHPLG
jgi:integrase/recombinase XerD